MFGLFMSNDLGKIIEKWMDKFHGLVKQKVLLYNIDVWSVNRWKIRQKDELLLVVLILVISAAYDSLLCMTS